MSQTLCVARFVWPCPWLFLHLHSLFCLWTLVSHSGLQSLFPGHQSVTVLGTWHTAACRGSCFFIFRLKLKCNFTSNCSFINAANKSPSLCGIVTNLTSSNWASKYVSYALVCFWTGIHLQHSHSPKCKPQEGRGCGRPHGYGRGIVPAHGRGQCVFDKWPSERMIVRHLRHSPLHQNLIICNRFRY